MTRRTVTRMMRAHTILVAVVSTIFAGPALAQETLKLAVGQRGNWESAVSDLGQAAGFFKKQGLTLEILYTQGGGETLQAVISGSVDLGIALGTAGVLGAYAKGAPVRVIGSAYIGANDAYFYVRADSPVQSMRDVAGKTIAFSTTGSSTNLIVLGLLKHYDVKARPVATGNAASTFTQVMSGQIDVGWASPPLGLDALAEGKIRIVARGGEVPSMRDQSVRLHIANARILEERRPVIARFMAAYRETLDWMYADPAAIKAYATWVMLPEFLVIKARDEFYPKDAMLTDRLSGFEAMMADAVAFRYLPAPLTPAQLAEFSQLLPTGR